MRKMILAHTALIYLLLSVGVAKSTHYCMGRVMNIDYFSMLADGCSGNDERKMPCCEDELELVKIESEHHVKTLSKSFSNDFVLLTPAYFALEFTELINDSDDLAFSDLPDPPDETREPFYVLTQRLVYYG